MRRRNAICDCCGAVQKKMVETYIVLFTEKTSVDEIDALLPRVVLG